MKVIFFENDDIDKIQETWSTFYNQLDGLHSFQSLDWQQLAWNKYRYTTLNKIFSKTVVCLYFKGENNLCAIFPFTIRNKVAFISGDMAGCDYIDFLYNNAFDSQDLDYIFNMIKQRYKIKVIKFRGIQMNSKSNSLIRELKKQIDISEVTCVGINLGESYELYIQSLSKSVRQNLRTAYNRLNRDGKTYSFEFKSGQKLDSRLVNSIRELYYERQASKYMGSHNFITNIKIKISNFIYGNKYNVVFESMKNNKNHVMAILYIDDKIASYCYGPISNKQVSFVQVAINEEFYKYSPGMILLSHLIEYLLSNRSSNLDIAYLDLTIGDEKYKYDLGGVEKLRYDYTVYL